MRRDDLRRLQFVGLLLICGFAVAYLSLTHLLHILPVDPGGEKLFFLVLIMLLTLFGLGLSILVEVFPDGS